MHHTLPDGSFLYYELHGNQDSPKSIVFLNGLSQSTIAWTAIIPSFAKDYQVLLIDLIFQGQSGTSSEFRTFDQHAADVSELLKKINPNKKWVIAGISYGGAVAQHFAVNHPEQVKALAFISTFAHKTPHFNAIGDSWIAALNAGGYPLMLDVMLPIVLGEDYFESPLIPISTLKEMRVSANLTKNNLLRLMEATEKREDYRNKLKEVKARSIIIHGEKDLLIPPAVAKEINKAIEGSKFEVIRNAGHTLNLEAIPQLSSLLREFSELV